MPQSSGMRLARCGAHGVGLIAGMALVLSGCGGGDAGKTDTAVRSGPAADTQSPPAAQALDSGAVVAPPAATPAKTPAAKSPAAKPAAKPATGGAAGGQTSPKTIALGDSIFHGQVAGGTCTACHGQNAEGTAIAPSLSDKEWLNGDGSYDFIVKTVTNGVPKPKAHPAPMPPKGGASLDDAQVKAVAAYVFSLSHKS